MSPVQVTCLIEQHLEETAQNAPGGEPGKFKITSGQLPVYFRRTSGVIKTLILASGNYSMDFLDVEMFRLKIDTQGRGDIGDTAIVGLDIYSAAIDYHDVFT